MTVETLNQMDPGIACEAIPDGLVIRLDGEWDLTGAPGLQTAIKHAQSLEPDRLVVDLGAVESIDSSILAVLIEGEQNARAAAQLLVLCGLRDRVRSLFEIARVYDAPFIITHDADSAVDVPNRRDNGRRQVADLICAQGVILDLSPTGMRLLSPEQLENPARLSFGLGADQFEAMAHIAWWKPARVKRTEYGLQFTEMTAEARQTIERVHATGR